MTSKKCELLAPAGSIDALKAAVYAGADAVYFGGGRFNARAFAENFGPDGMEKAFEICRTYGVKAYITLNTVVTDREMNDALEFVKGLERSFKPDAYIVSDVGLISVLKRSFPDIPLHASTQMQIHSTLAIEQLKKLGISRVVLARELSRENIKAFADCGIETEVFVHGAVCVSQSGGCLMSSFIGGNRGRCAQPCRQCYNGKYPLSLKDMCYASHIPELCEMGIDSLKIEGRMKSASYVYETVGIYRSLIDECRAAHDDEVKRLAAVFSRSGFSDGYYTGHKGSEMFGIRTESDKEISRKSTVSIEAPKIPAALKAEIREGCRAHLTAKAGVVEAEAFGSVPDKAVNRPLTREDLEKRFSKTGDTVFEAEKCSIELDEGLIMPISSLNALRRDALYKLKAGIIETNTPKRSGLPIHTETVYEKRSCFGRPEFVARFEGKIPGRSVLKKAFSVCGRVEVPLWSGLPEFYDPEKLSFCLPRTVFDSDTDDIKRLIKTAYDAGIRSLTVPNIGMLPLCEGFTVHGDFTLNAASLESADAYKRLGFDSVVISPEVRPDSVFKYFENGEYIVYGKTPLMHTENCIISNIRGCRKEASCKACLVDKTGASFTVLREYRHRNVVYNSVPTYLLDRLDEIKGASAFLLIFTDENQNDIINLLDSLKSPKPFEGSFTRAAYRKSKEVF